MRVTLKLVTPPPIDGETPCHPASPLAWKATYRSIFAIAAISGLWLAVGWALEWWGGVQ